MEKNDFDVIVIGGGAAGISAVKTAHGFGKKTAIVENKKLGGECTWNGCVPSKALIHAADKAFSIKSEAIMAGRNVSEFISAEGLTKGGMASEEKVKKALKYVEKVIQNVYSEENPESFEKAGITVIKGKAVFIDSRTISVDGKKLRAARFIIAAGSSPFIPPVEGIDKVPYYTNESIFEMTEIPSSMIVLGGGPIGIELAQAFGRLGVKITVVEMLERILFREDPELTGLLESRLRSEGITLLTGTKALKFEPGDDGVSLIIENKQKEKQMISGRAVLVAVGRRPNIEGLNPDNARIKFTKQGILVNAYLQTSQPNIYACGDIVGPYYFSHVAGYQGITAGINVSIPFRRKADYSQVLWTTYSDPELARAGLTEAEAKEKFGKSVRVYRVPYSKLDRAKTESREEGLAKYILNKKGRLIGAHIFGHLAGELIHEAQLARVLKFNFTRLQSVMHAYPSYSDIIRQASRDAYLYRIRSNPVVKLAVRLAGLFSAKKEK